MLKSVVQSGERKYHQKAKAIDARANDTIEVLTLYGKCNKNRYRDNTKQYTEPMHNAIDQFLFQPHLRSKSLHKERFWYQYCKMIARRILSLHDL
jgi:hypothetical protein